MSSRLKSETIALEDAPAELQELHAVWKAAAKDRRWPARGDIEPWDLGPIIGRICILEVSREPFDLTFRLDGTVLTEINAQDMTGLSVRDIRPAGYAAVVMRELRECYEAADVVVRRLNIEVGGQVAVYFRMVLPLLAAGRPEADLPNFLMVGYAGDVARAATLSRILLDQDIDDGRENG